jgi:pimeloyl-ACP methyl ester carboxylesterase
VTLGESKTVALSNGTIAYAERGAGPVSVRSSSGSRSARGDAGVVVFVHGLLVNANLWRKVVPAVADAGFRCITPTWPLGSHSLPMAPDADLTPPGVARLIADFLEALELTDVTVVANDTGGALTQLLMASNPERVGRVVLTPCDAFEDFFPEPFTSLPSRIRLPGAAWILSRALQFPVVQRQPTAYGWLSKRGIPAEVIASYVRPIYSSAGIRRDAQRFIAGVHNKYTLAAAAALPEFAKPVLLVRAADDRIFHPALFESFTPPSSTASKQRCPTPAWSRWPTRTRSSPRTSRPNWPP